MLTHNLDLLLWLRALLAEFVYFDVDLNVVRAVLWM